MVTHARLPSLEDLPPQQRSTTVAALRRGQIKISEPVPVENSGPSPVWKSPAFGSFPTDSVTGFGVVDSVPPHQHTIADVTDPPMYSESQFIPSSTDPRSDLYNPPKTSHGTPLRQKRSSVFTKDINDAASGSSPPRSSTNESAADFTMNAPNKKRRSGSIRHAFRKIFNKKEKPQEPDRPSTGRRTGSGHQYHKSVSTIFQFY
jgi:hypothetical protein